MYLKRFQVENLWGMENYRLDFQGKDKKIKQWSVIEESGPSQTPLLFKMLSLCLGAKCENPAPLAREILAHRSQKNKPVRFRAECHPDLDKKSHGSQIMRSEGEVSPGGAKNVT